jgi:hypothetical protein
MFRSLAFGKLATAALLFAAPLLITGCQTGGMGGWGWSPPSLSSLNPWRSSSTNNQLASTKPSNQVPTPPAQMLAGNGLARGGSQPNSYGTRSGDTYGGRNGGSYNTGDYGTRQVSATQNEGYDTGRYATGGAGQAQHGPYNAGGAGAYGGAAASTADRRSDPAYGAGSNNGWQGYNQPQNSRPAYDSSSSGAANQGASSGQNYSNTGAAPYSPSPYSGSTGVSSGTRSTATPSPGYGADAYRPGSTARAAEIQPTSYAEGSSEGNYPTTAAGDDSGYQ